MAAGIGGGNAGLVFVEAQRVMVTGGAQIDSRTEGAGASGTIILTASDSISLRGHNAAGNPSALVSTTSGRGNAQPILLAAPTITLADGARIETSTRGVGDAGAILLGAFQIAQQGVQITGPAVEQLLLTGGAEINSSSRGAGDGGLIAISAADRVEIRGRQSGLFSATQGAGEAGQLLLAAPQVLLAEAGQIQTSTSGNGDAGVISIGAFDLNFIAFTFVGQAVEQLTLAGGAQIASSALPGSRGDGGGILLSGTEIRLEDRARIEASTAGAGDAGGILIGAFEIRVVLNGSQVLANAFGGDGGNITISATEAFLASTDSRLDASSQLGLQGTVAIRSPVTEVSGALAPLSPAFSRAAGLLRDRCAERLRQGTMSSFIVRGRDGIPVEPDGLLPSPLEQEDRGQEQLPQRHLHDHLPAKDAYAYRFTPGFLALECSR